MPRRLRAFLCTCLVAVTTAGCIGQIDNTHELSDDPGVIFTYPFDGQADVSPDVLILASFTDAVDPTVLAEPCVVANGSVSSGVCLVGPDGNVVPTTAQLAGPDDNVIQLAATGLQPGTDYQVFVHPDVLGGAAGNIPTGPLIRFHTTMSKPRPSSPPTLVALNGDDPARFVDGASEAPKFPFADFTTLRLVFSEPVDPRTLGGIQLVAGDTGTPVAAAVFSQGPRVVIDPDIDLTPGVRYELRINSTVRDIDGEPAQAATYQFLPEYSGVDGEAITQVVRSASGSSVSKVSGVQPNSVALASPLIGAHTLAMRDSYLQIEMANLARFGTRVPITIRKGQHLDIEGLGVALAGLIPTDLDTDDLSVQLISDATGYLTRNPFRDPERLPDDDLSPVYIYLTFDISIKARDAVGNAVINQTVLDVQATGVVRVLDGGLTIETATSFELDLLGLTRAPSSLSMRFKTTKNDVVVPDTTPPQLMVSYPAANSADFAVDDSVLLTFSESIDLRRLEQAGGVSLVSNGQSIPARVDVLGTTVVITPSQPLPYGANFQVAWDGRVYDLAGNAAASTPSSLSFRTPSLDPSNASPMMLTTVYPGVPCAMRDVTATSAGRCVDGENDDDSHAALSLPANRTIEVEFNQPIDRNTATVGASCGAGSVRIERVDAAGSCVEAVAGVLEVSERRLRFVPDTPWREGQHYRLTLHPGGDSSCDSGELCGRNGMPLNTDGLNGMNDDNDGGGPDASYEFVATASTGDTYAITSTFPVADLNGNGFVDAGESTSTVNRAGVSVVGTSGIINSASLNGPDCMPDVAGHQACLNLAASLPVSLQGVQDNCMIAGTNVGSCIPVHILPQVLYTTSISMDANVVILGTLHDIATEQMMIRIREPNGQPIIGHVYRAADASGAKVRVPLSLYLDAPDMRLVGGLAGHDLHSKPLEVVLEGKLSFARDGRLLISLSNVDAVDIPVEVSALGIGVGGIDLQIPAGAMNVQLLGRPLKGASGALR